MAHPTEEPNPQKFDLFGNIFFHLLPKIHLEQQNPIKLFGKLDQVLLGFLLLSLVALLNFSYYPFDAAAHTKHWEQDFNHTAEEGKARYLFFYSGQEHNSELQSPRSHSIFSKSWRGKRGKRLLSCNSWHWFPLLCNLPFPSSLSTTPPLWWGLCLTVSPKAKANFPQTKLCLQRETFPTINQTEQIRIWPGRSKSSSGVYKGRWNFAPNWSEEDFTMVRFVYTVYAIQPTCISTKERKKVSSKVHLQVLTNSKARNDFLLHILPW